MLTLPPAFQFSQSSLQDYAECQRRFQLRYQLQQEWPAPHAEPMDDQERADLLGQRFHKMVERHYRGIPVGAIDSGMATWWDNFLTHPPQNLPGTVRLPEITLTARLFEQRLTATFDLLAFAPNESAMIVDWKTARYKPARSALAQRWQTVLYPMMLIEAAPRLLGFTLQPEQISLMYWFSNHPTNIEVFVYSEERYEQDRQRLAELLVTVAQIDSEVWPLTDDSRRCSLCNYRSLCDRGVRAGTVENGEAMQEFNEITSDDLLAASISPTDDYVL